MKYFVFIGLVQPFAGKLGGSMRIFPGFLIREIADETVAIPSGEAARHLSGLVVINGCGRYLFELLQSERTVDELVDSLIEVYDVDAATARQDVLEFLDVLRKNDMLAESPVQG